MGKIIEEYTSEYDVGDVVILRQKIVCYWEL